MTIHTHIHTYIGSIMRTTNKRANTVWSRHLAIHSTPIYLYVYLSMYLSLYLPTYLGAIGVPFFAADDVIIIIMEEEVVVEEGLGLGIWETWGAKVHSFNFCSSPSSICFLTFIYRYIGR